MVGVVNIVMAVAEALSIAILNQTVTTTTPPSTMETIRFPDFDIAFKDKFSLIVSTETDEFEEGFVEDGEKLLDSIPADYKDLPSFKENILGHEATTENAAVSAKKTALVKVVADAYDVIQNVLNQTAAHYQKESLQESSGRWLIFLVSMIAVIGVVYVGYKHVNWNNVLVALKIRKPKATEQEPGVAMVDLNSLELNVF